MVLLYVYVANQVVSTILSWVLADPAQVVTADPEVPAGAVTGLAIVSTVIGLAVAAGFVVLAVLVGRGNNVARIITWSLGGLITLCNGCGLIALGGMSALPPITDPQTGEDLFAAATSELSAWDYATTILGFVALFVALILLALPAANDYFRKREEVWVPPAAGYSAYPAYPPAAPGGQGTWPTPPGAPVPPTPPLPPAPPVTPPADPTAPPSGGSPDSDRR